MAVNAKLDFKVDKRLCKKCGICYKLCPKAALEAAADGTPAVKDAEACVFCMQCEMRCPDYAIRVGRIEK